MPKAASVMAGATQEELKIGAILLELHHLIPRFSCRNLARGIPTWRTRRKRSFSFSAGSSRMSLTAGDDKREIAMDPVNGGNAGEESTLTTDCPLAFCPSSSGDEADFMGSPSFAFCRQRPVEKTSLKTGDVANEDFQGRQDGFFLDLNKSQEVLFPCEDDDSEVQIITDELSCRTLPERKKMRVESLISEQKSKIRFRSSSFRISPPH